MKAVAILLTLLIFSVQVFARHGKGGSITYKYLGRGAASGSSKYEITAKHYVDCDGAAFIETNVYLGIFNAGTNRYIRTVIFGQTNKTTIQKKSFSACINPKPVVCYIVITYVTTIDLDDNSEGYILAEQECCRIAGIVNISNSNSVGVTNINTIPGVIGGLVFRQNSSPVYAQKDTVVICHNGYFAIDFSAVDEDGDQLTYSFCSAKSGATLQNRQPNPPGAPPYGDVIYRGGFSASAPLGPKVTIDGKTGLISGVAPDATGSYVISVCVSEFRNGKLIGVTKKEVQVSVADCNLSAANLEPAYLKCDNFQLTIANLSSSGDVDFYHWDFGVANTDTDTSTQLNASYLYADTGSYIIKLKVSSRNGCEDSATSKVLVYPGFSAGFTSSGSCYQSPFFFNDTSFVKYGEINSRYWDFGDQSNTADSPLVKNPAHQYAETKNYDVKLSITTSKGCSTTVSKLVAATDKPQLVMPFVDTLICDKDSLVLHAAGNGNFTWSPNRDILNVHASDATVFPKKNTKYTVTLNEKGCVATDSLQVNVVDHITVKMPADTIICTGDKLLLTCQSQALNYQWLPAAGLNDPSSNAPVATVAQPTTYNLTANLGSCFVNGSVKVKVADYPRVQLGADTFICTGKSIFLDAVMKGAYFSWKPANSLSDPNSLHPLARPLQTVSYILTVTDTLGCSKPSRDSITVRVIPPVIAFAGNDTSVVAGQPLQLQATGGSHFEWSPSTGLSDPLIANPLAVFTPYYDSVIYRVKAITAEGCTGEDQVKVRVFKTAPGIFVPNAFTPNADGMNDVFRPSLVGIKKLEFFRVFNRWGQLLFSTVEPGKGWDGRLNGKLQESGSFVYMAEGIDYTGKVIQKKGYFVLVK